MDGRRVVVALDEFRKYIMHRMFREMVEDFLLTARKNNAIVILVTQQPEHVLADTFGATLVGQCQTMMFFPTPTADETVYREKLYLTEGELRAVREDMPPGSRKILIKRQGEQAESVIVDFDLSSMPEYIAVLSGRRNTILHAETLRQQFGAGWLREFMRSYSEAKD
jgi:type IV secretion system protein VirB4